jgi:O-antigen ligase
MSSPCQEKRTPFFKFLTAFRIFKDNIFFGIGPKMFREVCKRKKYIVKTKLDASVDGCQTSPHNYYLQILTETGIFGIIPIIIVFFGIMYLFIKQIYFKFFISKNLLMTFKFHCCYVYSLLFGP